MDKVVIRTENNQFSGLGHMIRCFWIASALQKLKVNVILITEKTQYAKKMSSKFNLKLDVNDILKRLKNSLTFAPTGDLEITLKLIR